MIGWSPPKEVAADLGDGASIGAERDRLLAAVAELRAALDD